MDSIKFGNYLTELRKSNGFTQRYVAYELDVSDKAVSKWETGKSSPNIDEIRKLASLYDISVNELISNMEEVKNNKITKIVLTGGPCAGKTTALSWINNYFRDKGYTVLFVSETATELISNGVAPWTCKSNYDYQLGQVELQKVKEKIFEEKAKGMNANKILIVCDRGMLDNKAYMKDNEFKRILKAFNTSLVSERDSYDAVFHLVTAAKGKESIYTLDNNNARTESIEQARMIDDKIIASWTGHPHFRIIDNSTDFEEKLQRLLKEISSFLGEPEPFEIERKYLISFPNIKYLESLDSCTKIDISQTYLKSDNGSERRVRARGANGDYIYYLTEKKKVSNLKRIETEERLTEKEYYKLLDRERDEKLHTIHKTRYCLSYNNQYFEIDIYPQWDRQAIMEVELSSEDDKVNVPEFIDVIKDVTEEEEYKNYNMAKEMPKQLVRKLR